MPTADFLVIGAGIAGASVAYRLSSEASVIVLEGERLPGYHTTGRSAAFFVPSYGGRAVRPLTLASAPFFHNPPAGFADRPLLRHRPALYIGRADQAEALDAFHQNIAEDESIVRLSAADVAERAPMLRPFYAAGGLLEPQSYDIEAGALHQGFLKGLKMHGAEVVTDAPVRAITRQGGLWSLDAGEECYEAPVVINAAGAWGDVVALLAGAAPVGLTPMRRTIVTFSPGMPVADWPLVLDVTHQFYFKPESGRVLASPSDETPMPPCDVQPDIDDIAHLIDRLERATRFAIPAIARKWAGLRTFAPDRAPVVGFDDKVPGFFWLVGQGGFGMQTAPALSELAAALALGHAVPEGLAAAGITAATYGAARLR
jgi:D-arginine dehydrogenase